MLSRQLSRVDLRSLTTRLSLFRLGCPAGLCRYYGPHAAPSTGTSQRWSYGCLPGASRGHTAHAARVLAALAAARELRIGARDSRDPVLSTTPPSRTSLAGSNFVVTKKYPTGDGVFFSWVMACAIFITGIIVQVRRRRCGGVVARCCARSFASPSMSPRSKSPRHRRARCCACRLCRNAPKPDRLP